jgi:zinc protease
MAEERETPSRLDARSLPGPETVRRSLLSNGIVLLTRSNFSSPSVVLSGYLTAGALQEAPEKSGLADLTASALMRGTQARRFDQIYESIESIGANLGLGAGTHNTSFRGKSLAEDLGLVLDLLADVLQNPAFPDEQIERLRAEKLTGLAIRDQDTGAVAQMAFDKLAYPAHPYGLQTDGTKETVAALVTADLQSFHSRCYGPSGAVIAVVGAVEAQAAMEVAERSLGGWRMPGQTTPPSLPDLKPLKSEIRTDVGLPGKSQSDIVLGWHGPTRFDSDFMAASLGNSVLGRFGMMGRLGDVVREAAGLAYHVSSSVAGGPGPGPWQINAGVNPANVERALDLIRKEVRRFLERGVTRRELDDNRANFIGRLPLQMESNEGVAGALINIERFQLGLDYYQRYPESVAAVSRTQIVEAARRFLDPDRLVIAVAGPEKA